MESQPRTTTRPASGIPRLAASRLPLPTSTASKTIRPSPSRDRLQADPGLDHSRLRRPSHESLRKPPTTPRYSLSAKPIVRLSPKRDEPQTETDATQTSESASLLGGGVEDGLTHEPRGRLREERPSLSERTIETIAHIPPSPASVKRQSSFFNGASPIRSPSRTPSNVSTYSRSPSRSSSGQANGSDLLSQPVSKLRLPSRPRTSVPLTSSLASGKVSETSDSPSKMRLPSARQSIGPGSNIAEPKKTAPGKSSVLGGLPAKASPARPSLAKKPSKPVLSDMGPPERPLQVRKTRKPQTDSPSSMRSPSTTSRYVSAASTMQDELTPEQQAQSEARKASKSSSALRESIAKAKAAKKAAATAASKDMPKPEAVNPSINTWESIDFEDPFNQLPKGSNTAVLKKRVEGARMSGTLNIAAMSLTEIPKEVLNMYEFDSENSSNWFENVDLVKFIAADNELTEIADATFPDIDPADFDPDSNERGPQFGGLETLDLHGNKLLSLPMGIRRLHQLRVLNLSNNDLTTDKLEIIMEIPSLVDLKLAANKLEGAFPSEIGRLRQLETLDLRNNAITRLPNQVSELTNLKFLDVGENELTALPFEALSKLPLRTLNAPKNNLAGTLIPESVDRLEDLQSLNVANNGLDVLAANDMISLPNLHSLIVNVNRIKALPCISTWQSLSVLAAEENRLTEIPAGFVDLKNVKTVDFTGNNITLVDEKIGLIESLSTFKIANNPLRERKLLSMSSDEIIQDLRNRCEPEHQDTDDEGSVATQFTLAPETPELENGWRVKPGGVLDRSYSDLTDLESDKIELIKSDDIRCVYLQHNELCFFPVPALTMLAQGLVELDLSHNPLNGAELMSSSLELPKLQSLNLSAAGLTTLEPLLKHLQAPSMNFLDVSNNRLTGSLPHIRRTFLEVRTFLASDNQFSTVEFEAVQGLQVLDISNNDIDSLPPKIGLLGAERSPQNWGTGSALRRFEVAGNRFRVPRWQVVAKGTDAVLEFLKDHIPTQDLPEWEHEDAAARVDTF
ncbi:uncharacterized protein N7496_000434 [Penicillium cataractarum]|uniref:Disease resistance R13L4/SHOC-2-like LRR domain-containing protein n=1 Tax=Penicillium cataractarum TaxID=2100454 RepID=A0A9W9VU19_9EURO|nr:uncharacterized protein N7496_000434 [Penicillium cataractarum]KAJ5389366.1 hypothetical protein N7496_000434 [Penicillium cataractarum]